MQTRIEITPDREARFLETLAKTGSVASACQAAATNGHGPRAGKTSWYDHRRRLPEFAEKWDAALLDALAVVEDTIMDRALNPSRTPVTNKKGEVVGFREDRFSSDKLLLRIASRLDPASWAERRRQDTHVSGEITHSAQFALAPTDILLLPEPKQRELIGLLEEIRDRKEGLDPDKRIETDDGSTE